MTVAPVVTTAPSNLAVPEPADAGASAGAETDSTSTGVDGPGEQELARPGSRSASLGAEVYRDTDRRSDLPLTLSQLSPAKPKAVTHAPPSARPPPARAGTKRPPSAVPSGAAPSQTLKRSKTEHDAEETQPRAPSSTSQNSQRGRARRGAQGACQSQASQSAHAHVRHPSADHAAKTKASVSAGTSARERVAPGPSASRSSANAEEDGKRAAHGQLTGTRQLGASALATSSSGGRSGDWDSSGLRDLHKESQLQGAKGVNARRPASATGDHGHDKSAMERSVSLCPTIHRIASRLATLRACRGQALHRHLHAPGLQSSPSRGCVSRANETRSE